MANPLWVDMLLLLCFFLVLLAAFLYGRWCASGFKATMRFEPKDLRGLSSRTKATLLKHKGKILKPLGGKG